MRARLELSVQRPNGDDVVERQHEVEVPQLPEAGQWVSGPGGVAYTVKGAGWVLDGARLVPYIMAFRRSS